MEMPDLSKHIVTRRHITPKTFETELAAFKGSAFSVAPKLTQSACARPSARTQAFQACTSLAPAPIPEQACPVC